MQLTMEGERGLSRSIQSSKYIYFVHLMKKKPDIQEFASDINTALSSYSENYSNSHVGRPIPQNVRRPLSRTR